MMAETFGGTNKCNSASHCVINCLMMIAMMSLGLGTKSLLTFLGLLGMCSGLGNPSRWSKIQDHLGVTMEGVVEAAMKENLAKEIAPQWLLVSNMVPMD